MVITCWDCKYSLYCFAGAFTGGYT